MYTAVAVQWDIHVLCSIHICSVIYLKCVYHAPCYLVDEVTLYVANMCIHLSYKPIKYMAYIPSLVGIFLFQTSDNSM